MFPPSNLLISSIFFCKNEKKYILEELLVIQIYMLNSTVSAEGASFLSILRNSTESLLFFLFILTRGYIFIDLRERER